VCLHPCQRIGVARIASAANQHHPVADDSAKRDFAPQHKQHALDSSYSNGHLSFQSTFIFQLFAIIAYRLATSLLSITAFTHRTEIQAYLLI
jgi:hypothetical protein